ncbi:hypothetical protein [Stackebrandtia nassauensis]|uniref:Uncharacterized protein n=1 Tax=Stackebrandtia nassauensis (strain DSM 44728 / CIP 108903 / NRRL B-16338 / NBRC 102104 / LLR-40K-21) TaxID=446470 RepID=D3PZW8_STANL|nr:hypothetical protein [Stackebrandtia nassauensis]ADD43655.1 hypothetical protein Snas_4003 [Stackebrandtia nassauensis DSM 44728]
MIVGSLLLLLTGVVLLVMGLVRGDDTYLVGTIIASLLAAVCLYGASRRTKSRRAAASRTRARRPARSDEAETDSRLRGRADDTAVVPRSRDDAPVAESGPDEADTPAESGGRPTVDMDVETEAVPSDEPAEVPMSSVEAAALMRMDAEVMVVDGRPRFHLGGCVHLVGRDAEPLPAYEAVELGFGACALCRPAQSLLREPTRR